MRLDVRPTRAPLFALLLLGLVPSACKSTQVTEHRVETRKASAEGVKLLEVRNVRGDIEIVAYRHFTKELEITATYSVRARSKEKARADLKLMKLRVHRDGTKATVLVQYPDKKPSEGQSTRLRIVVPADSDLDADTGEGGIRVLGLTGTVAARTGGGNIEVMGARRAVNLETQRGDVRLSGDIPSFEVRTRRGDATVLVHERTAVDSPSSIVASAGNVSLSLSESFQGQLSLQARDLVFVTPFPALKKKGNTWLGTLGNPGHAPLRIRSPGRAPTGGAALHPATLWAATALRRRQAVQREPTDGPPAPPPGAPRGPPPIAGPRTRRETDGALKEGHRSRYHGQPCPPATSSSPRC